LTTLCDLALALAPEVNGAPPGDQAAAGDVFGLAHRWRTAFSGEVVAYRRGR
jgi:hypothetical protein